LPAFYTFIRKLGREDQLASLERHRSCTRVPATRGPNSHQDQGDNDEQ
jgi:hypothetical protein